MHHRAFLVLLLAPWLGSLSACRSITVEQVSPEFQKTGLKGKTLALGEVLSARVTSDPTPLETAATLLACEAWLKEKRPATRVVSYVSFGQQVGGLKTRFQSAGSLPLAALTPSQYQKAQAAGIDAVLFVEMLGKDAKSGRHTFKKHETTTEYDNNGKAQQKTCTQEYYESYATCWVDCRYYVVDVRTRQVVWQVSGSCAATESKEGGPVGQSFVPLPDIPAMPSSTEAIRKLVPLALRKLPQ